MDRMQFEKIKHDEARKAADKFGMDWTDLLDNTEQYERNASILNEADMREYWRGIFEDSVIALRTDS